MPLYSAGTIPLHSAIPPYASPFSLIPFFLPPSLLFPLVRHLPVRPSAIPSVPRSVGVSPLLFPSVPRSRSLHPHHDNMQENKHYTIISMK